MRSQARWAVTVVALVSAALMAGCGSTAPAGRAPAPEAPPAGAPFLATSLATAAGTWAVAVMGGSVATHDNFWQLFARPAGSPSWKLAQRRPGAGRRRALTDRRVPAEPVPHLHTAERNR